VLLVFGGSQGARSLNEAVSAAVPALTAAGVSILHAHGPGNAPTVEAPGSAGGPAPAGSASYVPVPYLERMDLAYAAADVALCRSGAMTVAEVSTVGLPAIYVPLPHGNGEQELNAKPVVDAGGGEMVPDAELTGEKVAALVTGLVTDPARLAATAEAARRSGHAGADETLARTVLDVAAGSGHVGTSATGRT
jgi:UDP-N-acetylglucosamine--N-acetylmuramyl-(pentapeptide) pyrophosphoryl-undecaprenol N-acetylglucosamine transferase